LARRPRRGPEEALAARGELTPDIVLAALAANEGAASKQGLARILKVSAAERPLLRQILKELEADGRLGKIGRRAYASADALPPAGPMDILERDADGELMGCMRGPDGLFGPMLRLAPGEARARAGEAAIGVGDRVLVRLVLEEGERIARVIKRLGQSAHRILGVFQASSDPRARGAGTVEPADRKARVALIVFPEDVQGARHGDLVLVELLPGGRPHGPKRAKVVETVGRMEDPRAASILAIHTHGIFLGFSPEEEREAHAAQAPTLRGRTDLRALPLITIDPEDARDHDDAVFAAPDDDPKNKGGVRVWVAIADVAAYVTPGSALDRAALKRGNSTYFPDRVAPMLPEALSADLCSLREGQERACLAVEMVFSADGRKKSHRFVRGLMKSAAKLSYGEAQAAFDGAPGPKALPLMDQILNPLWAAYQILKKGRDARAPLALASTEHRIRFDAQGRVAGVSRRETLEANKLIEEFMIQANVAAAEALEAKAMELLYRVHDQPTPEKIAQLSDFLETISLKWSKGEIVSPARFNRLLELGAQTPHADILNEVVLRTQAQAVYAADNLGHFGLNLRAYAHFTSPIRRYADLIVHRGLIRALNFGDDGLTDGERARLDEIAGHISMCERRSMAAEREAMERYIASFLAERVGAEFQGRISGVTRFGLFVKLEETGADGLAPISALSLDRWIHDDAAHALVNERTGARFQLGQTILVKLQEAQPITGGLIFSVESEPLAPAPGWRKSLSAAARRLPARAPRGGSAKPPLGKRKGRR
jgi:ribonuclease R